MSDIEALLDAVRELAVVSYSIETAAKATGYSPTTIRRAITAGDLPAHYPLVAGQPLGKQCVLPEDLRAWVAQNRTPPAVITARNHLASS